MKNEMKKAEVIRAMDILARAINNSDIFYEKWLTCGLADGEIDYSKPYEEQLNTLIEEELTDGEILSEMMGVFLSCMKDADEDGGLYVGGVHSDKW